MTTGAATLFDKVWDEHVIADMGGGFSLLHVDRNFIHPATRSSPLQSLLD